MSRLLALPLIVASLFAAHASEARAQKCDVDSGFRGTKFSFRDNNSRTIHKFDQLPAEIRLNLKTDLSARVGNEFFGRLKFRWGYAFDLHDTPRLTHLARLEDATDGYDLVFSFSDRARGLKAYYFKVVLDARGKITDDVALPDLASSPSKAQLISCQTAISTAMKRGFPRNSSVWLDFDRETKTFVWIVTDPEPVAPDTPPLIIMGNGTYRSIDVDANSGTILRIYKKTIIV